MKQTMVFAAFRLVALRKPYRWICSAIVLLLILVTSGGLSKSQSKDRDNPTRLTSNEISGPLGPNYVGDNYHYQFLAGPGEVTIRLSVEAKAGVNGVAINLFDNDAREIDSGSVMSHSGRTEQIVKRVNITRRQPVLLRIIVQSSYGPGQFRIRLDGAVNFGQDIPSSRDNIDNPECLPKKGILRVKMKDGSIRRIDLSEAEAITIEH